MIVSEAIEDYLHELAPPRSPLEQAIEADPPAAIVGPLEGRLLSLLVAISGSRRILEIGTASGYSALWLARGMPAGEGEIVTIERNEERAGQARANFQQAGYGDMITVHNGDAFDVLSQLEGRFDLIFVDILRNFGSPDDAPRLFAQCTALLRSGGLLVADNVLVDGEVLDHDPAPRVQGIREWNRRLTAELEGVIIPLRDGVGIGWKRP
jgi:predicted O-methyltransferase YrrM